MVPKRVPTRELHCARRCSAIRISPHARRVIARRRKNGQSVLRILANRLQRREPAMRGQDAYDQESGYGADQREAKHIAYVVTRDSLPSFIRRQHGRGRRAGQLDSLLCLHLHSPSGTQHPNSTTPGQVRGSAMFRHALGRRRAATRCRTPAQAMRSLFFRINRAGSDRALLYRALLQ